MTHASFSWKFANCVEEEVICRRQFVCQQPRKIFVLTIFILLTCLCLFWKPIFWPWPCQGNTFSCLSILQVKLSQTILLCCICVRNTSKYFSFTSIDFLLLFQISREWGGGYWRKINSTALSCESSLDSLIQNRTFDAEENMLKWFIHFHARVFDRFVNIMFLEKQHVWESDLHPFS